MYKSEVVKSTLDVEWKPFEVSMRRFCDGDPALPLSVDVYDWDRVGSNDLIGSTKLTLAELRSGRTTWDLVNPRYLPGGAKPKKKYRNSGVLELKSLEFIGDGAGAGAAGADAPAPSITVDGNANVHLVASGHKLDKRDFGPFGRSDPYFILSRDAVPQIFRSETVPYNLNPKWEPFDVSVLKLCGGAEAMPVTVRVYDWDGVKAKEDDLIGECTVTLQ